MSHHTPKRRPFVLFFLLASLIWAVIAWFSTRLYTNWQDKETLAVIEKRAREGTQELEDGLGRTILLLQYVTDLLSRYENIREAADKENYRLAISQFPEKERRIHYGKQKELEQINEELSHAVKEGNVISNIWIMKKDGTTIAAANASDHDSFVGTRFDHRSYFIDGMNGKKGHQYAVGLRSNVPGLFFASPIRRDNYTIGVVASKVNLSYLYNWVSQTNGILVDKYGVIIQAGNHQLEMMSMPDATVHMLSPKSRMERYNRTEFPVLSITPWEEARHARLPYMAFIIEFMVVTLVFLATGNFFYLLIIVPLHGILYLVSAHDPAIFDSLYVWCITTGRCRNSRFWGAASFSPMSVKRHDIQ